MVPSRPPRSQPKASAEGLANGLPSETADPVRRRECPVAPSLAPSDGHHDERRIRRVPYPALFGVSGCGSAVGTAA